MKISELRLRPRVLDVALCAVATCALLLSSLGPSRGTLLDAKLSLTPPRGWNSYDSFSWVVTEEEFLQNAEYVAKNLLQYGYEYVVVDFLWYRKHVSGAAVTTPGFDIIDEWGRLVPDPVRWPSTKDGKGFAPIAEKVHKMGLKFGIHIMRGISGVAVDKNTSILCVKDCPDNFEARQWTANQITVPGGWCTWMWNCFIRVNTNSDGGQAFIKSIYQQYADWGVDFIKHDCVFGVYDLAVDEIKAVGKAIESTGRTMLYSLSPGSLATPDLGQQVAHLSHMYRVTDDDWDSWWDLSLHFSVARDFAAAGLVGASGLWGGKSWPDLDMLPIGWLTDPGAPYGPYRETRLTKEEQRTQITLWAMAKSPLMFGGDLRHLNEWTLDLITQPVILEINAHSSHNKELLSSAASSLPEIRLEECGASVKPVLWEMTVSNRGHQRACWSHLSDSKSARSPRLKEACLHWGDSSARSSYKNRERFGHKRSGQLIARAGSGTACLESNVVKNKQTGKRHASFSPCSEAESRQVWHLTEEGLLVNEGDGSCAVGEPRQSDWKIWVAKGREGQSYVAFFNLGSEEAHISVAAGDVMESTSSTKVQPSGTLISRGTRAVNSAVMPFIYGPEVTRFPTIWSCDVLDVWNNVTSSGNISHLEATVGSHATKLFEIKCSPSVSSFLAVGQVIPYLVVLTVLLSCVIMGRHFYPGTNLSSYDTPKSEG